MCPVHTPDDIREASHPVESSDVIACLPLVGPLNELVHPPEEGICHCSCSSTNRRLGVSEPLPESTNSISFLTSSVSCKIKCL